MTIAFRHDTEVTVETLNQFHQPITALSRVETFGADEPVEIVRLDPAGDNFADIQLPGGETIREVSLSLFVVVA